MSGLVNWKGLDVDGASWEEMTVCSCTDSGVSTNTTDIRRRHEVRAWLLGCTRAHRGQQGGAPAVAANAAGEAGRLEAQRIWYSTVVDSTDGHCETCDLEGASQPQRYRRQQPVTRVQSSPSPVVAGRKCRPAPVSDRAAGRRGGQVPTVLPSMLSCALHSCPLPTAHRTTQPLPVQLRAPTQAHCTPRSRVCARAQRSPAGCPSPAPSTPLPCCCGHGAHTLLSTAHTPPARRIPAMICEGTL